MKKRKIPAITAGAAALATALMPMTAIVAFAEDFTVDEDGNYIVGDLLFTESGNGKLSVGLVDSADKSSITEIDIPTTVDGKSVISIAPYAFSDCVDLEDVTIPEGVVHIQYGAFKNCTSLKTVVIPDGVEMIGGDSFTNSGLTSITIPESVNDFGFGVFTGCNDLVSVYYKGEEYTADEIEDVIHAATYPYDENGLLIIDNMLFDCLKSAEQVVIPDGVTLIRQSAFSGCANLKSVTIPDSVTEFGDAAFENCTSLTSIIIPDSITSISWYAFADCTGLKSIVIPNSVTFIDERAFYNCTSLTDVYYVGTSEDWDKVEIANTTGGNRALLNAALHCDDDPSGNITAGGKITSNGLVFSELEDGTLGVDGLADETLTKIVIPASVNGKSVTQIAQRAFYKRTSLISVEIPDSVTSIGGWAFCNCPSLTRVTIPASVTEIGIRAFDDACTGLVDVYYDGTEEMWNQIAIDEGNETMLNAKIHFTSTAPENLVDYVDEDTGFTATADEGVLEEGSVLVAESIEEKTDDQNDFTFDISFKKGTEEVQPKGTVTVKIPVPEAIKEAEKIYVYHVVDGEYKDMDAELVNGMIVFDTDHFSEYLVTTKARSVVNEDPNDDPNENEDIDDDDEPVSNNSSSSANNSGTTANPDTGFAGISLALGLFTLAGAAVVVSRKRK